MRTPVLGLLLLVVGSAADTAAQPRLEMPYRVQGLDEREAAAHLLNRFTFGPRPGDVDRVVAMGLEAWLEQQLAAEQPETALDQRLARYETQAMTPDDLTRTYLTFGTIERLAEQAGVVARDGDRKDVARRQAIARYGREQGLRPVGELLRETAEQKLLRACYADNQLQEVLTDFWYNHFNVELTQGVRAFVLPYERDLLRPQALGAFDVLLRGTARHPAMLLYLNNAVSQAPDGAPTQVQAPARRQRRNQPNAPPQRSRGINENYARELMELHTLGVDGGYTQQDVVEVARAFTGWTLVPPRAERAAERRGNQGLDRLLATPGVVRDGYFLYRPDWHDVGPKTILGQTFPAGRGIEEGEAILTMLAAHPSTARHLARKFAIRFIEDTPSDDLVNRLAAVFTASGGDTRAMLRAIVETPEFWGPEALRAKVKTPFELVVSALRATDADVQQALPLVAELRAMGEEPYKSKAPTGYPDLAANWVNTGSLLARMNFGLNLAQGTLRGVRLDLAALNQGREPASPEAALQTYAALLLPGRDLTETLRLLTPIVTNPDFARRVRQEAPEPLPPTDPDDPFADDPDAPLEPPAMDDPAMDDAMAMRDAAATGGARAVERQQRRTNRSRTPSTEPPTPLQQVVGIILGSPEFQRQ